ncbi:hypothetical protein F5B19DRAFT_498838 [Rostrohypoxylon terebratum]|nr:hypothetical protein F5B19DRAFT_498838 [Rostrohypoxylon terebratum]
MVVTEQSAGIAGCPLSSIHADHTGMVKFRDAEDNGYKRVSGVLKMWMRDRPRSEEEYIAAFNTHMKRIGLAPEDIVDTSRIPKEVDKVCHLPMVKETVRWFIESPEFQAWMAEKHHTLLWLHGSPGTGKTAIMSGVISDLPRRMGYTKNWDLATIFCSTGQPEKTILASLINQLANKNKHRAHNAYSTFNSLEYPIGENALSSHLWQLLEAVVKGASDSETIFVLDGIDRLENNSLPTFLKRPSELERNASTSGAVIRIIGSSRSFPDFPDILADFGHLGLDKERREWNAREALIEQFNEGGDWILSHPEHRKWMENSSPGILWIEGKPGSRKSSLSRRIVKMLRDEHDTHEMASINASSNRDTIIAGFYYSFRGGIKESSHELMLRSIVYQIWKENARLFVLLRDFYRQLKSNGDNHQGKGSFWTYNMLKEVLLSLHDVDFPLNVFIVVDGMDESDSAGRGDLLNFLIDLPVNSRKCGIKVLIASRPETDIHLRLRRANHIVLQMENAGDIRKFVQRSFKALEYHILRPDYGEAASSSEISQYFDEFHKMENYIIENSQGVFLWVSLVFKELRDLIESGNYAMISLQEEARKLPKELGGPDGFYRAIVQTILNRQKENPNLDEDEKKKRLERSRTILAWVTFPKRPLLKEELQDVLTTISLSEKADFSCNDLELRKRRGLDRALNTYCGALVEVRTSAIVS